MKKILLSLGLLLGVSAASLAEAREYKVGITQIIEHPALDATRAGVERAFKEKGGDKKIRIEHQSAQGDFGTAQLIAKSFVSSNKDVIISISTPSSQAALNATKDIPIVFTAVTDNISAGLKGDNITGVLDPSPMEEQIQLLKDIYPNTKKVGFLYNPSEQNSQVILKEFKPIVEAHGMTVVERGVNTVNDINLALNSLLNQIDALYIPTDNLVASSATLINKRALQKKVPVIGAEEGMVKNGAFASQSIDFEKLGYQTGKMVLKILDGKKANEIAVEGPNEHKLVVNEATAKALGISLDHPALKGAYKY